MKVLFSALHFAAFRNFESVVRTIAARGHHVHLTADEPERFGGQALVERLAAECPNVSWGWTPSPAAEPWFPFAQKVRLALDYVRYLAPRYADAPKLRLRNVERAPRVVRWLTSRIGSVIVRHGVTERVLRWLERAMPRSAAIDRFIEEQSPDVLLLASLTISRSLQIEQLKAARILGVPTAACIMSWDHLSSKALLHIPPHLTLVWNDVQKQEAVEMHGLPTDDVVVTGAQCYDQWFARRPARNREEFCRSVGLDPGRPFVVYVCSAMSPVPTPVEPFFVQEWITALRSSPFPRLRAAGVLVRPHPERLREWNGVSLDGFDGVAVQGDLPIDDAAKADYFDSLYFSDAVVGLCTSAFLEAAIIGRPVLTLLLPQYRMHQDGMVHFRYLLHVGGGLLQAAADLPSHVAQLDASLSGARDADQRSRRFLSSFIRPHGLDTAATPLFVDAVERLGAQGRRAPDLALARQTRAHRAVAALATASNSGVLQWLLMDTFDSRHAVFERGRDASKREILERRAVQSDEERRTRDVRMRAKEGQRREKAARFASQQRAKAWGKWRRSLDPHRQLARFKGGVKRLIGG